MARFLVASSLLAAAYGHNHDGMTHRKNIWELTSCTDRLSNGPADADVEIQLKGLPPSTASKPVHLSFWTARKSPTDYNPLQSPVNCSVYSSMLYAYPKYTAADFNGGNVKVSETGTATIRVGAPSTYFVWKWISIPHIHLRLCQGTNDYMNVRAAVMMAGPDVWISPDGTGYNISSTRYTPTTVASPKSEDPDPVAVIVGVERTFMTTTMQATTTPMKTTPMPSTKKEVMLQAARDALDMKALTFSPVYACLLEEKFYNHFADDCSSDCPKDTMAKDGQCVRKETEDPAADFFKEFQLKIACNEGCWKNAKNASLHGLRLAVAGQLDIPFQEVMVKFGWETAAARRLTAAGEVRPARVKLTVASNRITTEQGSQLLSTFGADKAAMSAAMGLTVEGSTPVNTQVSLSDETTMDKTNDPYTPAYDAATPESRNAGPVASPLDGLPAGAIVGIAAGVLFLGICFLVFLWFRRRQATKAQQQAQQDAKVQAKEAKVADQEAPESNQQQQEA